MTTRWLFLHMVWGMSDADSFCCIANQRLAANSAPLKLTATLHSAQSVHCWKILHLKKVEKTKSKQVEKSHCVQSVRRTNYLRNKSVTICDTKNWQCFEFPPRLDSMPPLCSFDIYQYQVADSTTGDWWVIFAFHSDQKKDGKTAQKRDTQRWFKRLREGAQRESDECRWY